MKTAASPSMLGPPFGFVARYDNVFHNGRILLIHISLGKKLLGAAAQRDTLDSAFAAFRRIRFYLPPVRSPFEAPSCREEGKGEILMATSGVAIQAEYSNPVYRLLYKTFAYFGLFSIFGAMLYGFRHSAEASIGNYWFNIGLYGAFIGPHLIMTRSWFKVAVWGHPYSTPRERRFYIAVTVITWLALCWLHRPVPGPALALPEAIRFAGLVGCIVCVLKFFQGTSFDAIDGLLGVPGSVSAYSHGPETRLLTEGPYAKVRHPMYQAAILAGVCGLFLHPHMGQLLWTLLMGATFVAFIPVEEAQMITARGDDYKRYMKNTPYRLFRGLW